MDFCMREDVARHSKLITNPKPPIASPAVATRTGQVISSLPQSSSGVALLLYLRGNGPAPGSARHLAQPAAPRNCTGFAQTRGCFRHDLLLGFVEVPAGSFIMGSDKATDPMAFDNERWSPSQARGAVDLSTFYIGRYEVTVAQFQAFVGSHRTKGRASGARFSCCSSRGFCIVARRTRILPLA